MPDRGAGGARRRVVCFVDAAHFVHGPFLGYLWCFTRLVVRGPSGRQRFNVLGAIDAVTRELTTVVNETTIDATAICELLKKLSGRYPGLPLTLVLDNARYQRCEPVEPGRRAADRAAVPALVLPEPEPDRVAVEVRQEGGPVVPLLRRLRLGRSGSSLASTGGWRDGLADGRPCSRGASHSRGERLSYAAWVLFLTTPGVFDDAGSATGQGPRADETRDGPP